ncbi:hypothetical protein CDL15_Pgr001124 [Punica granatum]|uniref:Uncharacterized protein n=1 Tax=Punica granatum TaxID=22663 RepID=A0A218WKV9_PUNGR|nr:hypothetical protein CDL15_Pgr001124 [Punica granatum]
MEGGLGRIEPDWASSGWGFGLGQIGLNWAKLDWALDWPSWAAGRPGWAAAHRLDRSATYADSKKKKRGTGPVSRKMKQRGRWGRARRSTRGGRGFRRPCRESSGGNVVVRGSNPGTRVSELGDRDEPRETIEPPVFLTCELRESRGNPELWAFGGRAVGEFFGFERSRPSPSIRASLGFYYFF